MEENSKPVPSGQELAEAIEEAAEKAVKDLFHSHLERFYYCSLITSGHAHPPVLTAWPIEALDREAAKRTEPDARQWLVWSYGESPYFEYGGEYFGEVNRLFLDRPEMRAGMPDAEWQEEYELRLQAMEAAMKRLDAKGLFGCGEARLRIVVNVEAVPPDYTNTQRALRLNPNEALRVWLRDIAEPVPGTAK